MMELPFYFTLTDFQEKFKPDFINFSEMEQMTLSEYYVKLQEKYTNALTHFKNALSDLQYLKKEISQRKMEQLNYFYNNSDAPKTKVEKQIQLFNETYHLPEINLKGINTPHLEKYLNSTIPEMQKIIDLIRFEATNVQLVVETPELDFSENPDKVKLIMLEKLGIIDFIKSIQTKPETISHTSEILSAITGIGSKTLNTYLYPMLRPHPDKTDPNSPYKNRENIFDAEKIIQKLKIKNIDADR